MITKKIEALEDCIAQIEMGEYEYEGNYLKNNVGFIKLKELVKNTLNGTTVKGGKVCNACKSKNIDIVECYCNDCEKYSSYA